MTIAASASELRTSLGGAGGDRPPPTKRAFADFHIHTRFSRDSILTEEKFIEKAIERGLTHVAVTNHNNVEGAVAVRDKVAELGLTDKLTVILGEEVSTADGEVVGLFLKKTIPRGLSANETADEIHRQGGLVSIPHPFDPFRGSHIREGPLRNLAETGKIDMVEVFNCRVTLQRHNQQAAEFANRYGIPGIAASDSHSSFEVAMAFNALPPFETAEELKAGSPRTSGTPADHRSSSTPPRAGRSGRTCSTPGAASGPPPVRSSGPRSRSRSAGSPSSARRGRSCPRRRRRTSDGTPESRLETTSSTRARIPRTHLEAPHPRRPPRAVRRAGFSLPPRPLCLRRRLRSPSGVGFDWGEVARLVGQATSGFLVLAFVVYYATFPLRGFAGGTSSRSGMSIGFRDATEILFLSWFMNCLVPAKLGDLYRAYLLRPISEPRSRGRWARSSSSASRTSSSSRPGAVRRLLVVPGPSAANRTRSSSSASSPPCPSSCSSRCASSAPRRSLAAGAHRRSSGDVP